MPALSRLTSKYQATIPRPIRERLGLRAGDTIAFDISDTAVTLRRVRPADVEYLRAVEGTLAEWVSEADERAYGDL
jgi:AbrB family looped-hinge helix DNA binding protein